MSGSEASAKDKESYHKDEQAFLDAEWKQVAEFRGYPEAERKDRREELVGLALSGGGIRSAYFALGVLQSLAKRDVLRRVDYLSTVSGGGYIGSTLTWLLHDSSKIATSGETPPPPRPDTSIFPIGEIGRSRREDIDENQPAAILNFIRQHGNYLIPGQGLNLVSLITVVLLNVLPAVLVYFSLLVIALQVLESVQEVYEG